MYIDTSCKVVRCREAMQRVAQLAVDFSSLTGSVTLWGGGGKETKDDERARERIGDERPEMMLATLKRIDKKTKERVGEDVDTYPWTRGRGRLEPRSRRGLPGTGPRDDGYPSAQMSVSQSAAISRQGEGPENYMAKMGR